MSQTASISDRAILRFLAEAKKGSPPEAESIEATDYDWNVPCNFTLAQLKKLDQFVARVGVGIAKKLSAQLHEKMILQADQPTQHYAGRLALLHEQSDSYYVSIAREGGEQCGLVVISGELARGWVDKALGSAETAADSEREFSPLESALMHDIVATAVDALSAEFQATGGCALQCGRQVPAEAALPEVRDEDEYCVLAFREGQGDAGAAVSFVLASDVLAETIVARQSVDTHSEDPQGAPLACIGQALVTAAAYLVTVDLSLREVMSLEVGDVLVTETKVGQAIDLLVSGGVVLSGCPASCDGHFALQIGT